MPPVLARKMNVARAAWGRIPDVSGTGHLMHITNFIVLLFLHLEFFLTASVRCLWVAACLDSRGVFLKQTKGRK